MAITNPKTTSPIARKIQDLLHIYPHIRLGWIKAYVGHLGNEKADELAKGSITSADAETIAVPFSRSSLKRELKERAIEKWQELRDKEKYGRSTHKVLHKVELKSHYWPRQLIQFITEHGPFPSYLKRFGKHHHSL
ncbi:hypothetical protein AVEN_228885-1 [Araneus ventricosus]|uniref:RNase H type-1 domain-containing protein n=1 Tax=Araneus ventricosus TaxID=182803 RepID=A0A4Y2NW09_ARAVE|nr:hypothetical protein AVEN_228885-1 [Araneus ventricosus]